jgi:hypothetical protein
MLVPGKPHIFRMFYCKLTGRATERKSLAFLVPIFTSIFTNGRICSLVDW